MTETSELRIRTERYDPTTIEPRWQARWAELGVTEALFGLPDRDVAEIPGYVERLAGKLAAVV